MQIFLVDFSPIETAKALDSKRLNKQVLECDWMINSTEGSRVRNHPIYKMYKDQMEWVKFYRECLANYRDGNSKEAQKFSDEAMNITPYFLNQEYFDNFKKRLYTKSPDYYKSFESFGTTDENWYYLDGMWYIYNGGKIGEVHICNGSITKIYY